MDIAVAKAFFMWCTIINFVLMFFSFAIWRFASDWVYGIHSKWFALSKETFNIMFYSFLGVMKLFVFIFNFVPWMALLIIG